MSDQQPESGDRVVITASDFTRLEQPPAARTVPPEVRTPRLPWWGILAGSLLTLCLPLLAISAAAIRLALRGRPANAALWTRFLCTLLIVSGLLTSVAFAYLYLLRHPAARIASELPLGLVSHDVVEAFPSLPTAVPMTAVDLATHSRLLTFIVMTAAGQPLESANFTNAPLGAAVLLHAGSGGYLLATNRHVTDPPLPLVNRDVDRVLVVSAQGSYARADVVARHKSADLALLWVRRRSGQARFRQPVLRGSGIPVGSPVYVIGHPQGLFFTLSSGLVSRLAGDGMLQLSAPISPGNSGGPAYDGFGNLLGIVTYTVDKLSNPNAENLNFATPAAILLSGDGWDFREGGREKLGRFLSERAASSN